MDQTDTALSAIRHVGSGRVSGAAKRNDSGRDDCGFHFAWPRACPDRVGAGSVAYRAARCRWLEESRGASGHGPCRGCADRPSQTARQAGGEKPDGGAAGGKAGVAQGDHLHGGTGAGCRGDRTFGCGQVVAGANAHGGVAPCGGVGAAVWPTLSGKIRLDGAALEHYGPETLGRHVGYLPQRVSLFDGTIAQNIARLSEAPDAAKVVAAAKMAAAHQMILDLPDGYDTMIKAGQVRLSGGQMQRIALARALYDDPVILVLDEPNSNLDNDGSQALNQAIRAMKTSGRSVLIMAHRPAAIQECDTLLVLDGGVRVAFGPKDEVLKGMVKNHQEIRQAPVGAGGVT